MKIGNKIMVHAYKKNGWLYRTWEFPIIVESNDDYICLFIKNSRIITSEKDSKRNFHSINKNDSLWFFFKDEWFNIIATLNNNKSSYYINIASPYIYEEEAVKYIDFDYDIRISNNGSYIIIDKDEFIEHKEKFKYGVKLSKIIELELEKLNSQDKIEEIRTKISVELIKKLLEKANSLTKIKKE
ncbi:MAG: DUF402 domain-containing protein [Mycoplasmoidaceae bacterium]